MITRRRYLAARRKERHGIPDPKFRLGDIVSRDIGNPVYRRQRGEVSFIGDYDDYLGQYRYKVLDDNGSRTFWNENSMVLVRRPRKRRG